MRFFKYVFLVLSLVIGQQELAASFAVAGVPKVIGGNVIVTWSELDGSSNCHVFGAVGDVTDPPNLWTVQDITAATSIQVTTPKLYRNDLGDIVAVWQYHDDNLGFMRVAASRLPTGTTTWVTHIISDDTDEAAGFNDESADLDEEGNILVTWTSQDTTTYDTVVRGVTATMDTQNGWNASFVISQ